MPVSSFLGQLSLVFAVAIWRQFVFAHDLFLFFNITNYLTKIHSEAVWQKNSLDVWIDICVWFCAFRTCFTQCDITDYCRCFGKIFSELLRKSRKCGVFTLMIQRPFINARCIHIFIIDFIGDKYWTDLCALQSHIWLGRVCVCVCMFISQRAVMWPGFSPPQSQLLLCSSWRNAALRTTAPRCHGNSHRSPPSPWTVTSWSWTMEPGGRSG